MDLRAIAARGLKGFGQFTGDVTFAFETLPEGVVAIVGPNGHGKSTFLETPLAALYGKFPSRPENTLVASVEGKDAFLEVALDLADRGTYRARVHVDGVSRATDAVLELTDRQGVTRRLNDGKVTTFRDAVARELPSLRLVLASAFAAQTKTGSFADLDRAKRKELFAELLGLGHFEALASTARAAADVVDRRLVEIQAVVDRLTPETGQAAEDVIEQTAQALQADLTAAELAVADTQVAVAQKTQDVETHRALAARYTAATQERALTLARQADLVAQGLQLARDVGQLEGDAAQEAERLRRECEAAVAARQAQLAALDSPAALDARRRAELERIETVLANALHARDVKIRNNRQLDGAAIRDAVTRQEGLRAERATLKQQLAEAIHAAEETAAAVRDAQRRLRAAGDPVADKARAEADASLLATTPFGDRCAAAACRFVAQAATAQASLPAIEQRIAQYEQLHRVLTDLEEHHAGDLTARRELEARLDALDREIAALDDLASKRPVLEASAARIAELAAEQADLRAQAERDRLAARTAYETAVQTSAAARTALLQEIAALEAALPEQLAAAEELWRGRIRDVEARVHAVAASVEDLVSTVAMLDQVLADHTDAHAAQAAAEASLASWRAAESTATARLAAVSAQVDAFERRRDEFKARQAECRRLTAAAARLGTELTEWRLLARVLGPNGLPVIEIDAAGPGVSALANDLLEACFGGRFTVDLITQEAKVDGSGMKDVFDVRIFDSERGGERLLADLSGGERVIVDEAIRSAVALYVNGRNVTPIRTCWRDETIGALDLDAALRYVQMLRRVQERGGFRRVLFISHNLDAAALADAQIHIRDGQIAVRYPPFVEAA